MIAGSFWFHHVKYNLPHILCNCVTWWHSQVPNVNGNHFGRASPQKLVQYCKLNFRVNDWRFHPKIKPHVHSIYQQGLNMNKHVALILNKSLRVSNNPNPTLQVTQQTLCFCTIRTNPNPIPWDVWDHTSTTYQCTQPWDPEHYAQHIP